MKALTSFFLLFCVFGALAQTNDGIYKLDKEYNMNLDGTIKLSASDAKVYITGSSRSTAHVTIYRQVTTKGFAFGQDEFSVDIYEENGNLRIRENSRSNYVGMIGYTYEKYTITIEAPLTSNLDVKGDDGDYWIKNINGSIYLDLDDADVELAGCTGNKFEFRLDDGDVKMDQGRGSLDINADDADIEIQHAAFSSVVADMDDGDLIIETSLTDNGQYSIRSQDGFVMLTITGGGGSFDIRHDDSRVTTEGSFDQVNRSDDHTSLRLASGTARVDIRSDDARIKLVRR